MSRVKRRGGRQAALDVRVGCAGWAIPKACVQYFPSKGSHLERYAARFAAVEINSSFYRPHQPATYARWGATVPDPFQFAVKVPKQITHVSRLSDLSALDQFVSEAQALGEKLGPLLVQLPPSLAFDARTVKRFFRALRQRVTGPVVCEPRHASWFTSETENAFKEFQVARVAADPPPLPQGAEPGGWDGLVYYRLHGSPRKYYSEYPTAYLDALVPKLAQAARSVPTWCIFDNTAAGAATVNALAVLERLQEDLG